MNKIQHCHTHAMSDFHTGKHTSEAVCKTNIKSLGGRNTGDFTIFGWLVLCKDQCCHLVETFQDVSLGSLLFSQCPKPRKKCRWSKSTGNRKLQVIEDICHANNNTASPLAQFTEYKLIQTTTSSLWIKKLIRMCASVFPQQWFSYT
jgi:hypothetical protein